MQVFSVSEVARYLQDLLRLNPTFANLWVRGEVADLRRSPAGHFYFSLRDEAAQLRCVLFRSAALRLMQMPQAGSSLLVHGSLDFYPPSGSCQLRVDLAFPAGMGLQQLQFEALKLRLEQEGLFAPERKRPLPPFPRRIGVVASEGGAVIHDILTVLRRRYPLVEVLFVPSAVQGERAVDELAGALRCLSRFQQDGRGVDLVILARGGGSEEDLAAFNDERVARAVYACSAPVLSAIGHETDYTMVDLVADQRAPTPSAAAELATPDRADLRLGVGRQAADAGVAIRAQLSARRRLVESSAQRLLLRSPLAFARARRAEVQSCLGRAEHQLLLRLGEHRHAVEARRLQLLALDPSGTLERGYAICYNQAGQVVTTPAQVAPGQTMRVQVQKGDVFGRVIRTRER